MNFSVTEGIGWLGGWIIFGAAMIAAAILVMVIRGAMGGEDEPANRADRPPEDDIL